MDTPCETILLPLRRIFLAIIGVLLCLAGWQPTAKSANHGTEGDGTQLSGRKRVGFGAASGGRLVEAGEHFEDAHYGGMLGKDEAYPAFVSEPVDFADDRSVTDDIRPILGFGGSLFFYASFCWFLRLNSQSP